MPIATIKRDVGAGLSLTTDGHLIATPAAPGDSCVRLGGYGLAPERQTNWHSSQLPAEKLRYRAQPRTRVHLALDVQADDVAYVVHLGQILCVVEGLFLEFFSRWFEVDLSYPVGKPDYLYFYARSTALPYQELGCRSAYNSYGQTYWALNDTNPWDPFYYVYGPPVFPSHVEYWECWDTSQTYDGNDIVGWITNLLPSAVWTQPVLYSLRSYNVYIKLPYGMLWHSSGRASSGNWCVFRMDLAKVFFRFYQVTGIPIG